MNLAAQALGRLARGVPKRFSSAELQNAVVSESITCSSCQQTAARAAWGKSGSVLFQAGIVCPQCGMHHEGTNSDRTAATLQNA